MQNKFWTVALGIAIFVFSGFSVLAAEVPAGYILVPADVYFGGDKSVETATNTEISGTKSSIRINDEIGYVGEDYSIVTVTLRDTIGTAIAGKRVNLISSRATDEIIVVRATTSSNGEAVFSVVAKEEGVSALTAIEQSSGTTLVERPRIVFLQKAGGIGGNYLRSDVLEGEEENEALAGELKLELPDDITINSPIDIVVSVVDNSDTLIESFVGTVSFESEDESAILPKSYTFTEVDRGSHVFANAVTFTTTGEKSISVTTDDLSVAGSSIAISIAGEIIDVEAPVITSPIENDLLSGTIKLLGFAESNLNLAVFVDDEFATEGESDTDGRFLIEVDLPDGEYKIAVSILNADDTVGAISEPVNIEIDQTAPTIDQIILNPDGQIFLGTPLVVSIQSETDLADAQIKIGSQFIGLKESETGSYSAEINFEEVGDYSLDFELIDRAGNLSEFPEATVVSVLPNITIATETLRTTAKDSRVDLRWNPPSNSDEIKNYEINYGRSPADLNQKYITTDNRTAWYISELTNGTTYYFEINSFDELEKRNGGSEIVSETPKATLFATGCNNLILLNWALPENPEIANFRLDYGLTSGNYSESRVLSGDASRSKWEIRDVINGVEYFVILRGVDALGEVVHSSEEISVVPNYNSSCENTTTLQLWQKKDNDSRTVLSWNALAGATSYRVFAGRSAENFDLPSVDVPATTTLFRPAGLTPEVDYYFAVQAIFGEGHQASDLSNVTKVEVGPAEIFLISVFLAIASTFLIRRTKTADRQF